MTKIRQTWLGLLGAVVIAVAGSGGAIAQDDPPDDDGPGWKCKTCALIGCPDIGTLECFRGEAGIGAGPVGIKGAIVCWQGAEGSEGPACNDEEEEDEEKEGEEGSPN